MSDSSDGSNAGSHDPVGSAAEEAAKLLGALSGWAREHGSDLGHGLADVAAGAAEAAHGANEHFATGGPDCTYCPICRVVHVVRESTPEVRAHLAIAASSLMQAAAGLMATAVPEDRRGGAERTVEHIDLDAEGEWPEEED